MMGAQVWVPDNDACYTLATVIEVTGKTIKAKVNATGAVVSGAEFHTLDEKDVSESDLVQMMFIYTPNILNTLRHRHAEGSVYTNVGSPCAERTPYRRRAANVVRLVFLLPSPSHCT